MKVEICVEGVFSAIAAARGGADRVELCQNLAVGGVTPGDGKILAACLCLSIPVHVLIRPRSGDFLYDAAEFEKMRAEIGQARSCEAAGVVFGILTPERRVDRERTSWLIEASRPMSVTFHKAFDSSRDPFEALDDLIALGIDRVLTSGHAPTAIEGLATLAELTRRAAGRIIVMAGGSISREQVPTFLGAGLAEIHIGSAACLDGVTDVHRVCRIMEDAGKVEICHIATRSDWDRALTEGSYRTDSLATEGFIHASTASQVAGSANRFFRGRTGLVVLRIAAEKVREPIQWVRSPHSEDPFPHVYGPLNLDAVVRVEPLEPDGEGVFAWLP